MRNVLTSDEEFPFVDEAGRREIRRRGEMLSPVLAHDRCPITHEGKSIRLHTYAGGRINATIAALLEKSGVARVAGLGDLEIDLEPSLGGFAGASLVRAELRGLRDADSRLTQVEKANLVGEKNRGRLAKFQPYLPRDLEGAYLAEELFDFVGTAAFARDAAFPIVR